MPTLPAGSRLLAEDLLANTTIIDQLLNPTEQSYTPAWTSSGTTPTVGNGVRVGRYWRVTGGLWVDVEIQFTWGTTSAPGTGVWFWSLPVAAAASQVGFTVGTAYALDTGVAEYGGLVKLDTTTTIRAMPAVNSADDEGQWEPSKPFTFDDGDIQRYKFRYRAA